MSFIMMFIVPLSVYSRWATFPITIFTFITALLTTVGAVIATVLVRAAHVLRLPLRTLANLKLAIVHHHEECNNRGNPNQHRRNHWH